MGFMDLEKEYNRVNKESLWQVLRMYGVDGKLLNGITSMYVNSLPCITVKGGESGCFRINSGARQGCIMFPWLFNAVMKEVKMGREWRLPGLLYADDLVLCGELEENLRAVVGHFVEVCRIRALKVNASKSKVMVLGGEEGLKYEVCMDEMQLECVSEFKYLGCVLDEESDEWKEGCRCY